MTRSHPAPRRPRLPRLRRRPRALLAPLLLALSLALTAAALPGPEPGPAPPPPPAPGAEPGREQRREPRPELTPPPAPHDTGRPVVTTDHGPVRGRKHDGVTTYEGIPYAAPPTGALRWRPPRPARPWHGVRDAGSPGPRCPQPPVSGGGPLLGSEDCLHLDVTAPTRPAPARGFPVMVWLHGGGFTFGTGSTYRPERLVTRGGVLVVTVNYRLGMLGFLDHPRMHRRAGSPARARTRGALPFGLADQQAALRWVRENAARFGGDPGNVTLFGASAGGLSTCAQLVSPTAAGLFHKAIVHSGSCHTAYPPGALQPGLPAYRPFRSPRGSLDVGARAAERLGCGRRTKVLDCLRGLDPAKLATAELSTVFNRPAYGNALLPTDPARALEAGRFHRVPVMQGANRDEMRMFLGVTLGTHPIPDAEAYRARLRRSFGAAAGAVEARYPLRAHPTPALAWAAVTSDSAWACTTLRADRALSRHVPTYAYEFADRTAPVLDGLPDVPGFPYGAAHGFDLPYLLGSPPTRKPLTAGQRALGDRMIGYWTRFARASDPGGPGAPRWPAFRERAPLVLSLAAGRGGVGARDLRAARHCGFWDRWEGGGAR